MSAKSCMCLCVMGETEISVSRINGVIRSFPTFRFEGDFTSLKILRKHCTLFLPYRDWEHAGTESLSMYCPLCPIENTFVCLFTIFIYLSIYTVYVQLHSFYKYYMFYITCFENLWRVA